MRPTFTFYTQIIFHYKRDFSYFLNSQAIYLHVFFVFSFSLLLSNTSSVFFMLSTFQPKLQLPAQTRSRYSHLIPFPLDQ
jgi:hypothetical protein